MKRLMLDVLTWITFIISISAVLSLFVLAFIGYWWAWALLFSLIIYFEIKELSKDTNDWRNFRG